MRQERIRSIDKALQPRPRFDHALCAVEDADGSVLLLDGSGERLVSVEELARRSEARKTHPIGPDFVLFTTEADR